MNETRTIRVWARDLQPGDVLADHADHGPITNVSRQGWFVLADTTSGDEVKFNRLYRPAVHRQS